MRGRVRVHLADRTVEGNVGDDLEADAMEEFKRFLSDLMKSPPQDGWYLSLDLPDSGWAVFPRSSVLYLEWVPVDE